MIDNHHQSLLLTLARTGDPAAFCSLFNVYMVELFSELTARGLSPADISRVVLPVYRDAYKRLVSSPQDPLLLKGDLPAWHSRYVSAVAMVHVPNQGTGASDTSFTALNSSAAEAFFRAIKKSLMQDQVLLRKKNGGNRVVQIMLGTPVSVGRILFTIFMVLILVVVGVGIARLYLKSAGFSGALVIEKNKARHIVRLFGQLPLVSSPIETETRGVADDTTVAVPTTTQPIPASVPVSESRPQIGGKSLVPSLTGTKRAVPLLKPIVRERAASATGLDSTVGSEQPVPPVNESPVLLNRSPASDSAMK